MLRTSTLTVFALLIALVAAPGLGAVTPEPAPNPSPVLANRLAYFVGTWHSERTMYDSPFGPGGPVRAAYTCAAIGSGAMRCESRGTWPAGSFNATAVAGFDSANNVYTYDTTDATGHSEHFQGTVAGDTWVFTEEESVDGKAYAARWTVREVSPTQAEATWEISDDGGATWSLVISGTDTKTSVSN